jgi:hypothetical protein
MFWMIFYFIGIWTAVGYAVLVAFAETIYREAVWFEYVNPKWIYEHYQVNTFSCVCLTIWFSLYSPLGTIGYWLYKLCTVVRKKARRQVK